MSRRFSNLRPGALLLALVIAVILWGLAQGASSIERAYDVPIELASLSDELVVTDQTPKHINVRIMGSQAALRNVDSSKLLYPIDVSGSKPGDADFEVDVSNVSRTAGERDVRRLEYLSTLNRVAEKRSGSASILRAPCQRGTSLSESKYCRAMFG